MTEIGVSLGQTFEKARAGAINYAKAVEQMDVLFRNAPAVDKYGNQVFKFNKAVMDPKAVTFDPAAAKTWFDTFRKILPKIGEEFSGEFVRQAKI